MGVWTLEEGRWGDKCVQKNAAELREPKILSLGAGRPRERGFSAWTLDARAGQFFIGGHRPVHYRMSSSIPGPSYDNPTYPQMLPSVSSGAESPR